MKTYIGKIFAGIIGVAVAIGAARGATTNGCDNLDQRPYINSTLAMCSTHAYNIGETQNPTDANRRQAMNEVVALKTTVMTQQMYKQYEYLDAMVRRLKTQLEKAILTAKLEAAGAPTKSSATMGNQFSSNDRTISIAGVENCDYKATSLDVFVCLRSNFNSISQQSANGTNLSMDLRRQLANDIGVAERVMGGMTQSGKCETKTSDGRDCTKYSELGQKSVFQSCLSNLNSCIRSGQEAAQRAQTNNRQQIGG